MNTIIIININININRYNYNTHTHVYVYAYNILYKKIVKNIKYFYKISRT